MAQLVVRSIEISDGMSRQNLQQFLGAVSERISRMVVWNRQYTSVRKARASRELLRMCISAGPGGISELCSFGFGGVGRTQTVAN